MTNKGITTYILLAFLSITVFGFLAMGTMNHNTHNLCPFTAGSYSPCPESDRVATALHHVSFLEGFSEIVLSVTILNASLLLLSAAYCIRNSSDDKVKNRNLISIKNYDDFNESILISQIKNLNKIIHAKKINSLWSSNGAYYLIS